VSDITADGLDMEIESEDYWERYRAKPPTETLTEWRTKESETIAEQHTELNAEQCYQMTTGKPTDILLKLSTDGQGKSTKNAPKL